MKEATGVTINFRGMLLIYTDLLIQGHVKFLDLEIQRKKVGEVLCILEEDTHYMIRAACISQVPQWGKEEGHAARKTGLKGSYVLQ